MTGPDRIPDEAVDKARAIDVASVATRYGFAKAIPATGEAVGPCPGCGGRDRFSVSRSKNIWRCRQGGGDPIGGDAIALVEHVERCSFRRAVEILTGDLAGVKARETAPDPAAENEFREKERRRAYQLWREGSAFPDGGPVAGYLAGRGIDPAYARMAGAFCREHADMPYWHHFPDTAPVLPGRQRGKGEWRVIHRGPAMLWPIQARDGRFLGLHATWLDPRGDKGKAEIVHPETGEMLPAKKVRGSKKGGRIVLRDVIKRAPGVAVGEGVESVLSWFLLRERDVSIETSVDLGNLAGRAARTVAHPTRKIERRDGRMMPVRVPGPEPLEGEDPSTLWAPHPGASFLILIADGDSDAFATHAAMLRARARLTGSLAPRSVGGSALSGAEITTDWPPDGRDFNALLMGRPFDRLRTGVSR
jgi:hypothetical protein